VITLDQKLKLVTGHVESGNMKTFKIYFEETEIESLEALIANPDPERVKMYGGTGYVDMLKKKLERVKKAQAIQSHLKQSPLGKGIEDNEDASKAIRSAVNKSEAIKIAQMFDEYMRKGDSKKAKEVMFSIYDHDPEAYKHLYKIFRTQYPKDEDGEALERLSRQDHPGMVKYRNKDLPIKLSKGATNTLSRIHDKIAKSKEEDDNSYGGGALGPAAAAGHSQSGDWYAPGDYRVPKMLGAVIQKRTPPELLATSISGKRKKRRKNKKKK